MAVEVRYLVIRDGKEVGMYTTKKQADEHDKMLDIAENLFSFIEKAQHIDLKEEQVEELSIYFSQNREAAIRILKGAAPDKSQKPALKDESKKAGESKEKQSKKEK